MAYISAERVKEIRKQLKKEFPELKLSVRTVHNSTVDVSIMESPYDLFSMMNKKNERTGQPYQRETPVDYIEVNTYYIKEHWNGKAQEIFLKIREIASKGSYDRNAGDIHADYCDHTFYFDLSVGRWDKPYKELSKEVLTAYENPTKSKEIG